MAHPYAEAARRRVGSVLDGKWRLDALLGVGGMAAVYAATHRNGRTGAIKLLHPVLCTDESLVNRFLREGYVANRIGHPGAVAVLDDDRTERGEVFLVMELLDGQSLERYTKPQGERLPLEHVLRIADQTLDVLAAAHAKGVVHRDIKPANLFATRDGRVKVLDFGIARLLDPNDDGAHTQTGSAIGTPSYMPPEQARGLWHRVDARTDLWAVGATIYALVIGDRPRRAASSQEELLLAMTQPLPSLAQRAPGVAREVVALVDKATAHEPEQRFASAADMRAALGVLLGVGPASGSIAHPSVPGNDSAPIMVSRPGAPPGSDGAFTTGRPVAGSAATQARGRRTTVLVAAGSAIVVVGAVAGVSVWRMGRAESARSTAAGPRAVQPATLPSATTVTRPAAATPTTTSAAIPPPSTAPTASTKAEPTAAPPSTATAANRSAAAPPAVSSTATAPARPARPARPEPASSSPNLLDNRF